VKEDKKHQNSVGYGKPPKAHRFKPGQSGNPHGRPKGARNFKTELREELAELVAFREGDREITISKQRALIKRIVSSALAGDTRAITNLMIVCMREFGNLNEPDPDPEDAQIIKAIRKPMKQIERQASLSSSSDCNGPEGGSHEG
jgi:hypothetical protein